MVRKIALEEHFLSPGLVDYWRPTMTEVPAPLVDNLYRRLTDFDDLRLETMDKAGIAKAVLSVSGPGVQAERDPAVATRKAREANDFLAEQIARHPDRYAGFAHVAVQDAGGAMSEIVASVRRVSDIIGEITAAAAEQSDGIGQVNSAVTNLDQMTQQNAALVEQSAAAAESLKDQAENLAQAVAAFRA